MSASTSARQRLGADLAAQVGGSPQLRELLERYDVPVADFERLLREHQVRPALVTELLGLACTTYRSLDAFGRKAAYAREVRRAIVEACDGSGANGDDS